MRTMTIAQLRKKSAIDLAERKVSRPSAEEIAKAISIMNSYYRLRGLDERLLYLENDERTCNNRFMKELEEKREHWYERLNAQFNEYSAELIYFGYFPTICEKGTTRELYLAHFYK